jgi:hypothetical protein
MPMLQLISLMIAAGCSAGKVGRGAGADVHSGLRAPHPTQAPEATDPSHPIEWTGPCTRTVEQPSAKSFSIAGMNDGEIIPGILIISVSIIKPGQADVRGLTTHGINSRWGAAAQDVKDPFCWFGSDFRICVRPAQ